jgi:anti-sigma factor RsiW
MSHLGEKIAEFVFEELPSAEMAEARMHLAACTSCREDVARFQRTFGLLKAAPDVEPPRNIVFEFERPVTRRFWRWLPAACAVAALLLVTVALAGRVHLQWHDSQLTIAFGQSIPAQTDQTAELAAELQRVKGYVAYLDNRQQAVEQDTVLIAAKMQQAARAQHSPAGD